MMDILVSLDGKPRSEEILTEVERVSSPSSRIHLVHVLDDGPSTILGSPGARTAEARAYLQRVAARLPGRPVGVHLRSGEPGAEIPRAARELGAGLIALLAHGKAGFTRLFLGSVAETVVRRSTVPVLLSRPEVHRPGKKLERILVPIDGSAESKRVLDSVSELARRPHVEVTLLQVVAGVDRAAAVGGADLAPDPAASLRAVAYKLEREGMRTRPMVVFGSPSDQILEQAKLLDVDLIAMASAGRSGISRAFRKSISFDVLRHADRPVLLHRSGPEAEPGFVAQPLHVQEEGG